MHNIPLPRDCRRAVRPAVSRTRRLRALLRSILVLLAGAALSACSAADAPADVPAPAPVVADAAGAGAPASAIPAPPPPGSDRDAQGCIPSAGYAWCARTQQCERPWELAEAQDFEHTPEAFAAFCSAAAAAQ